MYSDEELVQRHLRGDEDAFGELVRRHLRSVYNLAYRSTGDVMEAENIVQETFARASAALSRLHGELSLRSWLLTIAVNLCRNWGRKASRQPALADPGARDAGGETDLERVADPAPEPLELLLEDEARAGLEEALAALPLPYRQALILRYMEDLSYAELSRALGLPLNTVRSHLFRAKEHLRRELLETRERKDDGLPGDVAALGSARRRATRPGRRAAGPQPPGQLRGLSEQGA